MPVIGGSGAHYRGPGAHYTGVRFMIGGSSAMPQVEEALEIFIVAMSSAESFMVTSLARLGPMASTNP